MTLKEATKNHFARQKSLEDDFFKDISNWILKLKPDAKTFEFDGHQESDDEGGANWYFSDLSIDDEDFQSMFASLTNEELKINLPDIFGDWKDSDFPAKDEDDDSERMDVINDAVRDFMYDVPDFAYEYGPYKIMK